MKILTGLFRSARKKLQLTHDNDMGAFREKLDSIVAQKDSLGDDEIQSKVEELKELTADLPDGDDKAQLTRFLEDFKNVKEQDAEVAKEAAKQVADLFERLDTSAMQDTPENISAGSEPAENETEDDLNINANGNTVSAANAGAGNGVKDDDPNPNYSLEEIYQFIKKRMSEDSEAPAEDEACEEPDETKDGDEEAVEGEDSDEEKTDEEIAQDHAPRISVRMTKDGSARGGIYEMFEKIKRGER